MQICLIEIIIIITDLIYLHLKYYKCPYLGVKSCRTMAYVLLHCDYISRFVLSCQFDISHRSNVVRRIAEKS